MPVGTDTRYHCGDEERRAALQAALDNGVDINGIDFLEVIDTELLGTPAEGSRQQILLVQCFAEEGLGALTAENVRIEGGVRVRPVHVRWARVLSEIDVLGPAEVPAAERVFLATYRLGEIDRERILAVGTDSGGDFSEYGLTLFQLQAGNAVPLDNFDPRLSSVEFSFKVECPSDFDCETEVECPPPDLDEPGINYLAKDYASFRRLMLDRMSSLVPDWRERNPADMGVALVELLAYVGDQLSYYQDAAATEAYLGTARRRISVRRHARLVDYFLGEGANARTWIVFEVEPGSPVDGFTLPGPDAGELVAGQQLLTRLPGRDPLLDPQELEEALRRGAAVFETMGRLRLRSSLNEIEFYTWSDRACCLPVGATQATLRGPLPDLEEGSFLLFEEVLGPNTGDPADADPEHRHVVRVTRLETGSDPLVEKPADLPVPVVEIEWDAADALPFPLCISSDSDEEHGFQFVDRVSIARGNVVPADHGRTIAAEELPPVPAVTDRLYRPVLLEAPLTHAAPLPADFFPENGTPERWVPAAGLAGYTPSEAEPSVILATPAGEDWVARRDLLSSGSSSRHFVAEMKDDGRARLRFGDEVNGQAPAGGTAFQAYYRVGSGSAGNLGRDVLTHLVDSGIGAGIRSIRNPLPAVGGQDAEALEEARRYAPEAFRVQLRAVTAEDYARAAERHPQVQKAVARFRLTASWHTVFVSIDRASGLGVDRDFQEEIRNHLNRFRMAGYDLEIRPPRFVPLDVKFRICVAAGYFRSDVARALLRAFSNCPLPDGSLGFFHPDHWTFGQPVYLSRLVQVADAIPGVDSAHVERFKRWGRVAEQELEEGVIEMSGFEIARLDNDPSLRENGLLELEMEGGL